MSTIDSLRDALRLAPASPGAHFNLGNALEQQGDGQGAVACFRACVQLQPDWAAAWYNLGNALRSLDQPAEAMQAYREALRLQPQFPDAHNNLGNILLNDDKDFDGAAACFRACVQLRPDWGVAWYNLGNALQYLGRFQEAAEAFAEALRLEPRFAEAHNNLGSVFLKAFRIDDAIASYQRALSLKPGFVEAWINLGAAYRDAGRLVDAVPCYQRVAQLKPDLAPKYNQFVFNIQHFNLGNAREQQGDVQGAAACFRACVQVQPDWAAAWYNLGNTLRRLNQPREAMHAYRRALRLRPQLAEAHNNLGNIYLNDNGDFDAAAASFRACVQLRPGWVAAWYNLGSALQYLNRVEEAAEAFAEALRLEPRFAEAHNNLGGVFLKAFRTDEAIASCQRALHLKPGFVEAWMNLGAAYRDAGRPVDAVSCYQRLMQLKPDLAPKYKKLLFQIEQELVALSRYREASKDILIVVRDQLDYLRQCIDSVSRVTSNYHLYIWDNGSGADTRDYLRQLEEARPDAVTVVRVESNRGFGEPNNQLASLGSGDYLVLLNSDTKVSDGWDRAMIGWLQEHPNCALVGYMGAVLDQAGDYKSAGFGEHIDFVAGWCACIARATYQEFGLFDPGFEFSHWEDGDLGVRLRAAGKSIYALNLGLVLHYWHKTTLALPQAEKTHVYNRVVANFDYFHRKWNRYIATSRAELHADFAETGHHGRGVPGHINNVPQMLLGRERRSLERYREASLDILIVVHDQLEYVRACIESVQRCSRNYHLYIWDNGSGADTQAYLKDLKRAHPDIVDLVRVESNMGFVEPNNRLAALGSGEYLILLHPDLEVGDDWDRAMIAWLQDHPECAVTGYRGGVLDAEGIAVPKGDRGERIDYICGSCACLARATYQEFGLFDPNFRFAYFEDIDLSLRLQAAGKKIYALHLAYVHHYQHKIIRALGSQDVTCPREAFDQNQRYFVQKWKKYLETDRVELRAWPDALGAEVVTAKGT